MAGFFIVFSSYEGMLETMRNGVYSTQVKEGANGPYPQTAERILADFASMREGDSIFFFSGRQVYGRGVLVNIDGACRRQNFASATELRPGRHEQLRSSLLFDSGHDGWQRWDSRDKKMVPYSQRWICTFEPDPCYWATGVDMDDLLDSDPGAFRVVRSMDNATFIKVDDQEEAAFVKALARANAGRDDHLVESDGSAHARIAERCADSDYGFDFAPLLDRFSDGRVLKHEMLVEATLMKQIAEREPDTVGVLSDWHHVSRQVPASPHKPSVWMDQMDLFGYSYLLGYEGRVIGRYFVGEVKKDAAQPDEVEQLMRYVDWVKDQYADNDYSLITAFLIASDFPQNVIDRVREAGRRLYTVRRRPATTTEWRAIELVRYSYERGSGRLNLELVPWRDA